MIGNGLPHKPCGAIPGHHEVHTYAERQTEPSHWCDGVPVLGPFVELTIRVPLVDEMSMEPATHEEALMCIMDEGVQTYVFDELLSSRTRVALRLRWGGEDRVYPLVTEHSPTGSSCLVVKK